MTDELPPWERDPSVRFQFTGEARSEYDPTYAVWITRAWASLRDPLPPDDPDDHELGGES